MQVHLRCDVQRTCPRSSQPGGLLANSIRLEIRHLCHYSYFSSIYKFSECQGKLCGKFEENRLTYEPRCGIGFWYYRDCWRHNQADHGDCCVCIDDLYQCWRYDLDECAQSY